MLQNKMLLVLYILLIPCVYSQNSESEYCNKNEMEKCSKEYNGLIYRYLLYDINPPEGFNLRRDVYLRMAVFAHKLHKSTDEDLRKFKLVLPPWINLYHWSRSEQTKYFPWSHFFDVKSLQKFAPVIEMTQFFDEIAERYKKIHIDEVYVLQHFEDMFETGNFEDRMSVSQCPNKEVSFYHYKNITSGNIHCLSFHGHTSQLSEILKKTSVRSIMFDHAEVPLHDQYGTNIYWEARRSMRFNTKLRDIANSFRKKYLNSSDEMDNTKIPEDWTQEKPHRTAVGGPYLSVHLRRRDFLWGRPTQVPSIEGAALQIIRLLGENNLNTVFVATDAPQNEYQQLGQILSKEGYFVHKFEDSSKELSDGQLAIVDQIICSHARYFIGTHESTFSFRIQEEREILGFPSHTTFNRLCGDTGEKCERPSIWKIVY